MIRAGPRPAWAERWKVADNFACRFMHAMHAGLFTKRLARKKASGRKNMGAKKPLVWQRLYGINEPGGMQNHNGPASGVLLLVRMVVVPVLFPAVAVR